MAARCTPPVRVVNADACNGWRTTAEAFDFIVVVFPIRPISRWASSTPRPFTGSWKNACRPRAGLWSIDLAALRPPLSGAWHRPWRASACRSAPYHALVPSFGEWGFHHRWPRQLRPSGGLPDSNSLSRPETTAALFQFPADMARGFPLRSIS